MTSSESPLGLVNTADGSLTLRSERYDEDFHSKLGAMTEARQLYMDASGYIDRVKLDAVSLAVLDIGLGLGYNALSTIDAWMTAPSPGCLQLFSLEHDVALVEALMSRSGAWLASFPQAWLSWLSQAKRLAQDSFHCRLPHPSNPAYHLSWQIRVGAAEELSLSDCEGGFDYFWQDAFSPKKNPELWSVEWFSKLRAHAAKDAVLVSYSVARCVRDHLSEAGWVAEKIPGPGVKRHWLRAQPL